MPLCLLRDSLAKAIVHSPRGLQKNVHTRGIRNPREVPWCKSSGARERLRPIAECRTIIEVALFPFLIMLSERTRAISVSHFVLRTTIYSNESAERVPRGERQRIFLYFFVTGAENGKDQPANFETAIAAAGCGKFHYLLLLAIIPVSWATSIDTSSVAIILPAAECDLQMTFYQKGILNAIVFVGAYHVTRSPRHIFSTLQSFFRSLQEWFPAAISGATSPMLGAGELSSSTAIWPMEFATCCQGSPRTSGRLPSLNSSAVSCEPITPILLTLSVRSLIRIVANDGCWTE